MKQVRETQVGKSIKAYVILNRKGEYVAKVQAHFADSGRVTVDVWDANRPLQQGSASGYGYDKFSAALSGLTIDGHTMSDHCGVAKNPPRGRKTFPVDAKAPKGYTFANFVSAERAKDYGAKEGEEGWLSCYRLEGFRYLEALGYRVIQAI